jgi:hypothetical protein
MGNAPPFLKRDTMSEAAKINAVVEALRNAPAGQDDYTAYLEGLLEGVDEIENPNELFPHAFRFFEDHAEADLGMPGPLVHFLEQFHPQYLDELCASVARTPTIYTIWMLNRILNGKPPKATRQRLIDLLRQVVGKSSAASVVKEEAQQILDRQK